MLLVLITPSTKTLLPEISTAKSFKLNDNLCHKLSSDKDCLKDQASSTPASY